MGNSNRSRPPLLSGLIRPADRIVKLLAREGLTLVTAESCTAGLLAAALSNGIGASDVLQGGFVVYTKAQKTRALGVSPRLLKREGSVSEKVAREMARGALQHSPADLALAVTGVLGPAPDEDGNPVGLVWLCCASRQGKVNVARKRFPARGHQRLAVDTVRTAFTLVAEMIGR